MDFYGNEDNGNDGYREFQGSSLPPADPHVKLATAAMILSIIGVVFGIQVFGIVFSGIAIVLAVLSKGDRVRMETRGKAALILGIAGVCVGIVSAVTIFISAWRLLPGMLHTEEFHQALEQFYGDDTDAVIDYMTETYPWLNEAGSDSAKE